MFSLFDPTGRGHISNEQYENGERANPGGDQIWRRPSVGRIWFQRVAMVGVACRVDACLYGASCHSNTCTPQDLFGLNISRVTYFSYPKGKG